MSFDSRTGTLMQDGHYWSHDARTDVSECQVCHAATVDANTYPRACEVTACELVYTHPRTGAQWRAAIGSAIDIAAKVAALAGVSDREAAEDMAADIAAELLRGSVFDVQDYHAARVDR